MLTPQVWLCGGSVEVVPCSRIAHVERAHKPYALDLNPAMRRNALRVADIWLDEYKKNVHIAWNIPFKVGTVVCVLSLSLLTNNMEIQYVGSQSAVQHPGHTELLKMLFSLLS